MLIPALATMIVGWAVGDRGVKRAVPCRHGPFSFVPTVLRAVPARPVYYAVPCRAVPFLNRVVPCRPVYLIVPRRAVPFTIVPGRAVPVPAHLRFSSKKISEFYLI